MFRTNEVVTSGNSTARVNYYFPSNNFIVLIDTKGSFKPGDVITGRDSGFSVTLVDFSLDNKFDTGTVDPFIDIIAQAVTLGINDREPIEGVDDSDGELVAIDEYFTGEESEDFQTAGLVVNDG